MAKKKTFGLKAILLFQALVIIVIITLSVVSWLKAYDGSILDNEHNAILPKPLPTGTPWIIGQGSGGDPVYLRSGNFVWGWQDMLIPELGVSFNITRFYNSREMYNGPFGYGWHFYPFMRLIEVARAYDNFIIIKRGDGARLQFRDSGDGTTFEPMTGGWDCTLTSDGTNYFLKTKEGLTHTFDDSGRLVATSDRNGNQLTYAYDGENWLKTLTDATNRQIVFTYGNNGKIASIEDFSGRKVTYEYDTYDNLRRVTDPLNQTTRYEYDSEHQLISIFGPDGKEIIMNTYAGPNQVFTQSYNGGTVSFSYDADYTQVQNRRGFDHDVYLNDYGNPTRILLNSSGQAMDFEFNEDLRLTKVIDPDGETTYSYDNEGNIQSIKTPLKPITSFSVVDGQITSIIDSLTRTTSFTYDGNGNLETKTDALLQDTIYERDPNGKLRKVTVPGGLFTEFTYTTHGYLETMTDTIGADVRTVTFGYDDLGNVTSILQPDGTTITNEYDDLNRLTKVTDTSFSPARVYDYEYDTSGQLVKITENAQEKSLEWTDNRLATITYPDDSNITYAYNENDYITQAAYSPGTISYTYDSTDRIEKVTHPDTSEFTFTKTNDYVTQIDGPGGISIQLSYDAEGRLTGITDMAASKGVTFGYDDGGKRNQMVDSDTGTTTYTYDNLDRLESVIGPAETTTFSPPIPQSRTVTLNEILTAYNFNQHNRLNTLVAERLVSGDSANYIFGYPKVSYGIKPIEANKRWYSRVEEEYFDKRPFIQLRVPFELIK